MKRFVILVACSGLFMVACDKKEVESKTEESATSESPKAEKKDEPAAAKDVAAPVTTAKVGEPAPDFTLKDQDGNEVKLSQFKGKPVVLEWTEEGCPFVKRHYTAKTMARTFEASGGSDKVVWLAVNSSHFVKAEEEIEWRKKEGFDYPVLLDPEGKVGAMYNAKTTPHMYVIDKEGVLRYAGAIDDDPRGSKKPEEIKNYVSEALEALEAGKPVETPETKPYGCSVKYKS